MAASPKMKSEKAKIKIKGEWMFECDQVNYHLWTLVSLFLKEK